MKKTFKVGNNVKLGRNMFLYFHCSREVIKIRISSKIINVKQREVICFLIFANFFYMDCLRLRPVTKCDQMTKFFCRIMRENWAVFETICRFLELTTIRLCRYIIFVIYWPVFETFFFTVQVVPTEGYKGYRRKY